MESTAPRSCTLENLEMIERISAWREVSSHAISREVGPECITSVYPQDAALLRRLEDLIAAEASCCSFMKFEIQERDDHTIVRLTFPEEARPLIETVTAG